MLLSGNGHCLANRASSILPAFYATAPLKLGCKLDNPYPGVPKFDFSKLSKKRRAPSKTLLTPQT